MKIAWIGTGVMGKPMVSHIISAGYQVTAYNRSLEKLNDLSCHKATTLKEAVNDADVIFSIVGYPRDVEQIYLKEDGIFTYAKTGAICIDMTTSSATLAEKLYTEAKKRHLHMLDAPVSGGDIGAKNASLSIMVGGDEDIYIKVNDLLQCLGNKITYIGAAGSGQHCKMVNQIVVAGNIAAITEGMVYAKEMGLDGQTILSAIGSGAAASWQVTNNGPKILSEDFAPGFYIHHFIKDLNLVKEEAAKKHLQCQIAELVVGLYESLSDEEKYLGTQALIKAYQK